MWETVVTAIVIFLIVVISILIGYGLGITRNRRDE